MNLVYSFAHQKEFLSIVRTKVSETGHFSSCLPKPKDYAYLRLIEKNRVYATRIVRTFAGSNNLFGHLLTDVDTHDIEIV